MHVAARRDLGARFAISEPLSRNGLPPPIAHLSPCALYDWNERRDVPWRKPGFDHEVDGSKRNHGIGITVAAIASDLCRRPHLLESGGFGGSKQCRIRGCD